MAERVDLSKEAERGLREYWDQHPEAYLKIRDEQIARCLDSKGRVIKKHREAHAYYMMQKWLFEFCRRMNGKTTARTGKGAQSIT